MELHRVNTDELYERLQTSIREIRLSGKIVHEIRLHPRKFDLLAASAPIGLIELKANGVVTFRGVPLVKKMINNDVDWELQT